MYKHERRYEIWSHWKQSVNSLVCWGDRGHMLDISNINPPPTCTEGLVSKRSQFDSLQSTGKNMPCDHFFASHELSRSSFNLPSPTMKVGLSHFLPKINEKNTLSAWHCLFHILQNQASRPRETYVFFDVV